VAETAWRILLFALLAGASPIAIVSTLAALGSGRGRTNGLALAAGFLLGQTAALLAAFLVGSAATTGLDADDQAVAVLELVIGLALLAVAWPEWRRRATPDDGRSRTKALLDRLKGLRPGTAFTLGALLGVGGLKRLSITIVAGATIAVAGLDPGEELFLGLLYVAIGGMLVWVPVAGYLVAGARADEWMTRAEDWLVVNGRRITFVSTLVFGILLTVDSLARLLQ
jgi:threonine/homoserine/homoserine lactone efflux protein